MCVAAFALSVFRMSDQSEMPVLGSITEMRVEPGGTASSAPENFVCRLGGRQPEPFPARDEPHIIAVRKPQHDIRFLRRVDNLESPHFESSV